MRHTQSIDYKKRTLDIDKKVCTKSIDRKTTILLNMIKILLQNYVYYEEMEYVPEFRAYDVFNP